MHVARFSQKYKHMIKWILYLAGETRGNDVSHFDDNRNSHPNLPNGDHREMANGDADNSFDTVLSSQAMSISDSIQDIREQELEVSLN